MACNHIDGVIICGIFFFFFSDEKDIQACKNIHYATDLNKPRKNEELWFARVRNKLSPTGLKSITWEIIE